MFRNGHRFPIMVMSWCDGDLFVNAPAVWFLNQEQSKICRLRRSASSTAEVSLEDAKGLRNREGEYLSHAALYSRQPGSKVV